MRLSGLEEKWQEGSSGFALLCNRREDFDPRASLFHNPMHWEYKALPPPTLPTDPGKEWTEEHFRGFVRDEFGIRQRERPLPPDARIVPRHCDYQGVVSRLLRESEGHFVYGDYFEKLLVASAGSSIPERLFTLFTDDVFGRDVNSRNLSSGALEEMIASQADLRIGLRLAVLGLPFRDQNPFRTTEWADVVTLAEAAFLVRLHVIALAIYQLVPTGANWVILSDGRAYCRLFGVDEASAQRYLDRVRDLRSLLNLTGTVSVLDLQSLIDRFPRDEAGRSLFDRTRRSVEDHLWELQEVAGLAEAFSSLIGGIRWNMNTRSVIDEVGRNALWAWLHSQPVSSVRLTELDSEARIAALRYAAFNLTLRYYDVVNAMLPGLLRATVHPKAGQIAVPRLGQVSPWNGVAVARESSVGRLEVSIAPLHAIPPETYGYHDHRSSEDYVFFSDTMEVH